MSDGDGPNWAAVGAASDGGQLRLDRGAARRSAQRCAEFVGQLQEIQLDAKALEGVDGFGDLPSGVALAAKFGKKAVGGDYSMVQAIDDHIKVVQQMRQVFEKIEAAYGTADEAGAQGISGAGAGI